MRMKLLALAGAVAVGTAMPAAAQNNGLVVVDLSDSNVEVLNDLARNLNLEVNDNNVEALKNIDVQVPIGLAAAICGVDANILAKQRKTEGFKCTAKNNSAALTKAVKEKMPQQ